ncbi:hypothetical protein [Lachnoclostridium sp. Marseille-P6806]|uniref:hypothetical protein n=1 Tax=Lachnoclostridium sp. Marseille-P6806 TaxID=2364793 RepID=UPI001030518D|nr:hypothetical protein [Lachnoclostridium sp. Marseille-P6806]
MNRRRIGICTALILMAFALSKSPWYAGYMAEAERLGCAGAREWIAERYAAAAEAEWAEGENVSPEQAMELLGEVLQTSFDGRSIELDRENGTAGGLCRGGGTFFFSFDSDLRRLSVRCGLGEHGDGTGEQAGNEE